MSVKENVVRVMLSPVDQSAFCAYDKTVMYPVPNAWGKKGATCIDLKKVKKTILEDEITAAYNHIIAKSVNTKPLRKK